MAISPSPMNCAVRSKADLLFPIAGEPQGFSTLATTQWDGSPEPVVREILQNCLDASKLAERSTCQVTFRIQQVPVDTVPGMDAYRRHFEAAVREREEDFQGAAEKQTILGIKNLLSHDHVRLLTCCDNGIGLSRKTAGRLLTEGNTGKDKGAGAFGLGHLTAFAASDLRYILYAGRSRNTRGAIEEIATGHAILASWAGKRRGAHGYWMRRADRPSLFEPKPYPRTVPRLLAEALTRMDSSTGAVVCIVGFNNFRDTEGPAEAIARVAAKNFLVAIHDERMVIRIEEDATEHNVELVDSGRLDELLSRSRRERRAKRKGWLPGEQAYRCLMTLLSGDTWQLKCSAQARLRRLQDSEGGASRVQIFRDGMWITNTADELTTGCFTGYRPFDAVVMIDGTDSAIGRLVRDAEGPEHRGLDRRRLAAGDRRDLLSLLRGIRDELRLHTGKLEQAAEYVPDDFAVFGDHGGKTAERVPSWRPRATVDADASNVTTAHPTDDEPPIDPPGRGRKSRRGRGARPTPGTRVRGRYSLRPVADSDGSIRRLRVHWRPDKSGRGSKPGTLGVRVRVPSGSDATCDHPIGPRWIRIREIRVDHGIAYTPYDDGFEASVPHGEIHFTVVLATRIPTAHIIEVDFVRRIRKTNGP